MRIGLYTMIRSITLPYNCAETSKNIAPHVNTMFVIGSIQYQSIF